MRHPLRFRRDGSFIIAQLTDLHWQDDGDSSRRTCRLIEQILDLEQPDLVVLTGDVLEGSMCSDPEASWRQAVAPIESRSIPWAAVFGNHDTEGIATRTRLMRVQESCAMCLSRPGPRNVTGVGNYTLPIHSARDDTSAFVLYMLDSGGELHSSGEYESISDTQIGWYRSTSRRLASHRTAAPVPALAFFHIPLPEFEQVWERGPCRGEKHESVCCPPVNSGFFAALSQHREVVGVFVGHDHLNDFEGTMDGIRLCYGRATGFGGYGQPGFSRGARIIQLTQGLGPFNTWIVLEGGARIGN